MANQKTKTVYCCAECGYESANWAGKCPSCGAWNSMKEFRMQSGAGMHKGGSATESIGKPKRLSELDTSKEIRFSTGISELDRVLGGGAVCGSLILVGGAPGIGKSTLLLQLCGKISEDRVILYITGEESERQIKLRAERLGIEHDLLYVYTGTDMDGIRKTLDLVQPEIMIVDSIQTISDSGVGSMPGSPNQVRECTMQILRLTKDRGMTVFLIGHITKEGSLAGPKILEHMVDCVLYFEGERETSFRILRAVKNRFGSTNEIGVFEMHADGLICVENPSALLLSGRPEHSSGTCVTCVMEGSRPILAEIQALVSPGGHIASRRSNGIDFNRASMLIAVLEKRGGIPVTACDPYVNVVGGLTVDGPAADLATGLALASSYLDRPLGSELGAIGEVGLSGELRQVSYLNQRLSEIHRLGFRQCVVPANMKEIPAELPGLELIPVKNIRQAIQMTLSKQSTD